jgi:hypothetical protein
VHRDPEDAGTAASAQGVVDDQLQDTVDMIDKPEEEGSPNVVRVPRRLREEAIVGRVVPHRQTAGGQDHARDPATATAQQPAQDEYDEPTMGRLREARLERGDYRRKRCRDTLEQHVPLLQCW